MVVAFGLVLTGSTAAHAAPSVADLEKQIDDQWNKLEPVIERHNSVKTDLQAKRKQANELQAKIMPLQLQVDLAMGRVGDFAAEQYKSGNTSGFNALLGSGSPTDFMDRLSILNEFAREQQNRVDDVSTLKAKYDSQKGPLDALVSQLTKTEADLAAQEKQINVEIDKLQKLRIKAYGSSGAIGTLRLAACPYEITGGKGGAAAKFACNQIGKPYVWATDGPKTYDCSGLTKAAWESVGISLPHNAYRQYKTIRSVSRSQLQPGDLVFYYSDIHHVGIYVGGDWVVHAPSTGDKVRMRSLSVGTIHSFGRPG